MIRKEEVFKVGQLAKPHGVKGEIALTTRGDFGALEEMEDPYVVCDMDGILVPFFVESFRYKSDSVVLLKFDGLDTDEAVRPFVNKEAYLPLDAVSRDDLAGEMAWDDFVGYRVIDEEAKRHILQDRFSTRTLDNKYREAARLLAILEKSS